MPFRPHGAPSLLTQAYNKAKPACCCSVSSPDGVCSSRNIRDHYNSGVYVPLTYAIGPAWDQLKTIDRINKAIKATSTA